MLESALWAAANLASDPVARRELRAAGVAALARRASDAHPEASEPANWVVAVLSTNADYVAAGTGAPG